MEYALPPIPEPILPASEEATEGEQSKEEVPDDPDIIRRDTAYYSDHVVFKVGHRLFKVPRSKFQRDSEIFRDMFALPTADGAVTEGSSDDHPLELESIETDEFRALLHVMFQPHYGPNYEESKVPTLEEWISVLKLTTMWQFARLRRVAIDNLRPLLENEDPVRWIVLACKYDVHEWLLPSLHALARRPQAQQLNEVDSLGIVTVVKMAEVRESYTGNMAHRGQYAVSRSVHNFEPEIRRLFADELRVAEPKSRWSEWNRDF